MTRVCVLMSFLLMNLSVTCVVTVKGFLPGNLASRIVRGHLDFLLIHPVIRFNGLLFSFYRRIRERLLSHFGFLLYRVLQGRRVMR